MTPDAFASPVGPLVPMGGPLVLTYASYGEILRITNPAGVSEPYFILHGCGDRVTRLFCVTCGAHLPNQYHLELHIERGGAHHIAVYCNRHQTFESAN